VETELLFSGCVKSLLTSQKIPEIFAVYVDVYRTHSILYYNYIYTVGQKKLHHFIFAISLSNQAIF